ncbi:MAG: GTP cyclohydrolase IIa, partial [Hadesarchaea archaeon]|nr:GTP cyclohydrolase IIa [Hadesarchaea archaeon]
DEFASREGLIFSGRIDNMLGATNQITFDQHKEIQDKICEEYPINLSMSIGTGETPKEAQEKASQALQEHGSSQSKERQKILTGNELTQEDESWVEIAHIDVNHATPITDNEPFYHTHQLIQNVYTHLTQELPKYGALVFFTGGDNFMAFANKTKKSDLRETFELINKETGVKLKAGIGKAQNAEKAAGLADKALDAIRAGECEGQILVKRLDLE